MSRLWIASLVLVAAMAGLARFAQSATVASGSPMAGGTPNAPLSKPGGSEAQASQQKMAARALGSMAGAFVENGGQWDAKIRYALTGKAVSIALTDSCVIYQLVKAAPNEAKGGGQGIDSTVVRPRRRSFESTDVALERLTFSASFDGSHPAQPEGVEEAGGKIWFYTANAASGQPTRAATFKGVQYKGLYDGIDLVVRAGGWGIRYEFHAAPNGPVDKIVMKYDGVTGMKLDDGGRLHINTAFGALAYEAPTAWQESGGQRKNVSVRMRLVGENSCGFEITGPFDGTLPLVISL